jgi:SNF2 family DNA or RNA helicase
LASSTLDYEYRTEPFDHQREVLEATWDREAFAVFWEQGTGKTKLLLDTAAALYQAGKIDCLFVVAPNGVHRNWIAEEINKHVPVSVLADAKGFAYHSSKAKTKKHLAASQEALKHEGFAIIAISYDAFMTDAGKKFAKSVLTKRECLYILDESARVKSPSAKRTKTIISSARFGKYRRILTGTPVSNKPFDIFTQMKFLHKDYWKDKGLNNFTMFKSYFAIWAEGQLQSGRTFPILVNYKNLEELHDMIQPDSSRVLKCDVLDLPPKLYSKRYFDMSSKQTKLYNELRDNFMTEMESGDSVTADLAITRILRLQQITCGYVAVERETRPDPDMPDYIKYEYDVVDIEAKNLRLKLLQEIVEDMPGKAIIWARFTRDIDMICEMLGDKAVRYDGQVKTDDRAKAIQSFQHDDGNDGAQFFVANAQAAGEGLTLTKATTVIYYNNNFKLSERLQSEDRAHRIGQEHPVQYIDIVCNDTIDQHIVDALIEKKDIARIITGDAVKQWL